MSNVAAYFINKLPLFENSNVARSGQVYIALRWNSFKIFIFHLMKILQDVHEDLTEDP